MKKRIGARLSHEAFRALTSYMEVHKISSLTEALERMILTPKTSESKIYVAEASPSGDRAKCPIGFYKGRWITRDICRKCGAIRCDLKS